MSEMAIFHQSSDCRYDLPLRRNRNRHGTIIGTVNRPTDTNDDSSDWKITRRGFVASAGMLTGGLALGIPLHGAGAETPINAATNVVPLKLTINTQPHMLSIDQRWRSAVDDRWQRNYSQ
jgi:hypothetical protein